MPTLELEKLGLESLESSEALSQIVGGRRSGVITLVPYNNVNGTATVPGFVQEVRNSTPGNPSPVTVFQDFGGRRTRLGTMTVQSNGKYFGKGSRPGQRLRAQRLFFDDLDIVEYEALRGSRP